MTEAQKLGVNRTPLQAHTEYAREMVEAHSAATETQGLPPQNFENYHLMLIKDSEAVGSVPIPRSLKGLSSTGFKKIVGQNYEIFMDKLGERLAFERTGVRLYDALLNKYKASDNLKEIPFRDLERIRNEELEHFRMLQDVIGELGADPTGVTPSADLAGVMGSGLIQAVGDPRNDFAASLEAILIAELADNDAWNTLIKLAEDFGHENLVEKFSQAVEDEKEHLSTVRDWLSKLTRKKAGII